MSQTNRRIAEALERIADALEVTGDTALGTVAAPATIEPLDPEYLWNKHLLQRDDD